MMIVKLIFNPRPEVATADLAALRKLVRKLDLSTVVKVQRVGHMYRLTYLLPTPCVGQMEEFVICQSYRASTIEREIVQIHNELLQPIE